MKNREHLLYEALGDIDPKFIKEAEQAAGKGRRRMRFLPAMIAAVLALLTLATMATVLIYQGNMNDPLVTEGKRLSRVPDGYVAITTAEELNAVRQDLGGHYILMSDISLAGWQWEPIGTYEQPFYGIFNGNGYVISDMTVTCEADRSEPAFVGLFGSAPAAVITNLGMRNADIRVTNVWSSHVGVIAGSAGYLMSSYTEDCRVSVDVNINVAHSLEQYRNERDTVSTSEFKAREVYNLIGGLVGKATTVDSCISATDVTVGGYVSEYVRMEFHEDYHGGPYKTTSSGIWRYAYHYAGKISGVAYSVITSLAEGTLTDETGTFDVGFVGHERLSPAVLPVELYETMSERLKEVYVKPFEESDELWRLRYGEYRIKKWQTAYWNLSLEILYSELNDERSLIACTGITDVKDGAMYEGQPTQTYLAPRLTVWKDAPLLDNNNGDFDFGQLMQPLFYGTYELEDRYYVLDLLGCDRIELKDYLVADEVLAGAFTVEELRALWDRYHLRVGNLFCYDLSEQPDADFEGFDFQSVWMMKDGRPVLRVFE